VEPARKPPKLPTKQILGVCVDSDEQKHISTESLPSMPAQSNEDETVLKAFNKQYEDEPTRIQIGRAI
jgi:hypothetical protein